VREKEEREREGGGGRREREGGERRREREGGKGSYTAESLKPKNPVRMWFCDGL
jgi:hypothetical protein